MELDTEKASGKTWANFNSNVGKFYLKLIHI